MSRVSRAEVLQRYYSKKPIQREEVVDKLSRLKNNKAVGPDDTA